MVVGGCGSEKLPVGVAGYSPGSGSGGGGGTDDAGPFTFDGGTSAPPGCGIGPSGGVCDCIDSPLATEAPNFYFVLDRSGSMGNSNKWETARLAVGEIINTIGRRAKYGAAVFPGDATCGPGKEIMSVRLGDLPLANGNYGPVAAYMLTQSRAYPAEGGTPTAQTLDALAEQLPKLPGKTFVVLATDGGPNCGGGTCGSSNCMPNIEQLSGCTLSGPTCCTEPGNCLEAEATNTAVARLKSLGISTFVIGMPGSVTYATLLDRLATTGGTAQSGSPGYYRVDSADKADLMSALRKVASKIVATCTYELKDAPPDVGKLNVYLDEVVVPRDGGNAWKLDGKTVTLVGETCDKVMRGDVLDVRIILGCPTVEAR